MKTDVFSISEKGIALIAAIHAGFCPSCEEGRDTEAFEKFWSEYQTELSKHRAYQDYDAMKMLEQEREDGAKYRANYRRAYLCGTIFTMLGFIAGAIITYLLHFQ